MTREQAARQLGVAADAGADEVERAFRRRARSVHPDAGGDAVAFRALVEARSVLLSANGRRGEGPVVITNRRTRITSELQRRRRQVMVRLGKAEPRVQ